MVSSRPVEEPGLILPDLSFQEGEFPDDESAARFKGVPYQRLPMARMLRDLEAQQRGYKILQ